MAQGRLLTFALCTSLMWGTIACNVADNQELISDEDQALANPAPSERDFQAIQAQHEILLGVIDTGVDYNHPNLINHIEFDLDENGTPTGTGWDVTGQDSWPSPYLVRTALYDEAADAFRVEDAAKTKHFIEEVLAIDPALGAWLHPMRDVEEEENTSASHGTHVAGLMTYDDERLGLKPYRVLPINAKPDLDENAAFGDALLEAIEHAAQDGVRVVNLSLGMRATRRPEETINADVLKLFERISASIESHPEMLFVVAAGNDGGWVDNAGGDIVQMPCGFELPNILCVGSTAEDGRPSGFTNILLGHVDLVFAWGENLKSTVPTKLCAAANQLLARYAERSPEKIQTAKETCESSEPFQQMSGTSMASPVVARLAAQILLENSVLQPAGVIEALRNQARPAFIGRFPIYKLKIDRPSWMPKTETPAVQSKGGSTIGAFELVIPDRRSL